MIAVHLFPREKVRAVLKEEYGCEYVEPLDARNDVYRTPAGFHFTVPAKGEDGMCARVALHQILASLAKQIGQ